jgi:hypothetical protein
MAEKLPVSLLNLTICYHPYGLVETILQKEMVTKNEHSILVAVSTNDYANASRICFCKSACFP